MLEFRTDAEAEDKHASQEIIAKQSCRSGR